MLNARRQPMLDVLPDRAPLRILLICSLLLGASATQPRITDVVDIVSIAPGGPLTRGVPQLLTIVIDAKLTSASAGVVQVGFNDEAPDRFRMTERRTITGGSQRIEIRARAIPVDWGSEGSFTVAVRLGGPLVSSRWAPTASAERVMAVKP